MRARMWVVYVVKGRWNGSTELVRMNGLTQEETEWLRLVNIMAFAVYGSENCIC
jgi:hypothetical protein